MGETTRSAFNLLITGTDTDVGKSVVAAALAAGLRRTGLQVRAIKPVASGVEPGQAGIDAELLALGGDHEPCIWQTFRAPVSPHRAALLEGWKGSPDDLRPWLDGIVADALIVEGAGGWRVPLLPRRGGGLYEVSDLAADVGGAVIVVAADKLGVLNHARLTVRAVQDDGFEVVGVVLNRGCAAADDASTSSNLDDLCQLLDVPVVPFERLNTLSGASLGQAGDALIDALPGPWRGR